MKTFLANRMPFTVHLQNNRAVLEFVALQVSIRLNSTGRVLGTRWVSCRPCSIGAIWKNYQAFYKNFHKTSVDTNCTSNDTELNIRISKGNSVLQVLLNMGFMMDILTEVEHLSLNLQDRELHCQRLIF